MSKPKEHWEVESADYACHDWITTTKQNTPEPDHSFLRQLFEEILKNPDSNADIPLRNQSTFNAGCVNARSQAQRSFWRVILQASTETQGSEIMDWLTEGVRIEKYWVRFQGTVTPPPLIGRNYQMTEREKQFASNKLKEEVQSGIRIKVGPVQTTPRRKAPTVISPTGIADNGEKLRKIDSMEYVNQWCSPPEFTMQSLVDLPYWTSRYATVLDFASCFMHFLLHWASRTFFGTRGFLPDDSTEYYFVATTLVFGWNCSPYICQRIVDAIARYTRSLGIPIQIFYDDSIIGELALRSKEVHPYVAAKRASRIVTVLFTLCGFYIGLDKSQLEPKEQVLYLGLYVNLSERYFAIPEKKKITFLKLCREIQTLTVAGKAIQIKSLERIAGKCANLSFIVQGGMSITREFYNIISKAKAESSSRLTLPISSDAMNDLKEWIEIIQEDRKYEFITSNHKYITQTSDANSNRWAATSFADSDVSKDPTYEAGGEFDNETSVEHIGVKEAVAMANGFERAMFHLSKPDNSTWNIKVYDPNLYSHANSMISTPWFKLGVDNEGLYLAATKGSSRSKKMNEELKRLFRLARKYNIRINFFWLSTTDNLASDKITREDARNDYRLSDTTFAKVEDRYGPFDVDGMASNVNTKCEVFFSRYDCPRTSHVNLLSWQPSKNFTGKIYVYPPFAMISVTIQHLRAAKVHFTIVAPYQLENYWTTLNAYCNNSFCLGKKGDKDVIFGWNQSQLRTTATSLKFDMWAFDFTVDNE